MENQIIFINVDRFIEQIEDEIERVCDEDFDYSGYKEIVKFFKEYEGYTADWKEIKEVCNPDETSKEKGK